MDQYDSDLVREFYESDYARLFNSPGLMRHNYSRTHVLLESTLPTNWRTPDPDILELGAGQGEHLSYVLGNFRSYTMVDLRSEPPVSAWTRQPDIEWISGDACDPGLNLGDFDRVLCMCLLHHVAQPRELMVNVRKWLRPGGTFSVYLPCDPGLANRAFRKMVVLPQARRLGILNYDLVNAREHRNHYWALAREMTHQFREFERERIFFPLRVPVPDINGYSIWHWRKPF